MNCRICVKAFADLSCYRVKCYCNVGNSSKQCKTVKLSYDLLYNVIQCRNDYSTPMTYTAHYMTFWQRI